MKTTSLVGAGFLAVCISLIGCGQEPDVATEVSFANDVLPILEANCVECHDLAAEGVATSGLNLSDYKGVLQGTRSGVVAVPNSSESSALYLWLLTRLIRRSRCRHIIAMLWWKDVTLH